MCGSELNILNPFSTIYWFLFNTNEMAIFAWIYGLVMGIIFANQYEFSCYETINSFIRIKYTDNTLVDTVIRFFIGFSSTVLILVYYILICDEIHKFINRKNDENEIKKKRKYIK